MRLRKLVFCLLLSVVLTVTFIPNMAFAVDGAGTDAGDAGEADGGFYVTTNVDANGCVYQLNSIGEAQILLGVFNSHDEEIGVAHGVHYTWNEVTGIIVSEGDDSTEISLGQGEYRCVVEYQGERKEVFVNVPDHPKAGTWTIMSNADDASGDVKLDPEHKNADLQVQVFDNFNNDVTQRNELVTYQWESNLDKEGKQVWDENNNPVFAPIDGAADSKYTVGEAGRYRCVATFYDGHTEAKIFAVEKSGGGEPKEWTANAVQTVVHLDGGKATLEVSVIDAYGHDIASQCRFDWNKIGIKDGLNCELIGEDGGQTYTVTEAGNYACVVSYDADFQDVVFVVQENAEWEPSCYAHAVQKRLPLKNGKAKLQVYVLDKKGNDITRECTYYWFRSSSLKDAESEPLGDSGHYDGKYETLTASKAGIYHCIASYDKKYSGGDSLAFFIVTNSKDNLTALKVNGLKVKPKKKKAIVTWKTNTKASGYVIQYSMKKNFKKAKVKKIKKAKTKKTTIKKLKSKKKYYFRIAPYTKVKDPITGEVSTVQGKWSKAKKVKIK